jgi:hypothetical protein
MNEPTKRVTFLGMLPPDENEVWTIHMRQKPPTLSDEEALALDRRQWAAYLKTLGKREQARLRRLRKNRMQAQYRERLDEEGKERERELKREWWHRHRTDPEFKRKRAAKERRRQRKLRAAE